jgi:DNA invertase Pin-like site-specific DNA recombinase
LLKKGFVMTVYGYARVSSHHQTLVGQDTELHKAGAAKVYREKISGAAGRRPQLEKLLRVISEGDVVLVTRLDRLARSTRDLLNILDKIGKAGAQFKSLRETWADTTTPVGKLMITIIGGIAEFERELIRARTGDGIRRAKAAGVHMGRPSKLTKHQQCEVLARLDRGETLTEIARSYAVSHMTISRVKAQYSAA